MEYIYGEKSTKGQLESVKLVNDDEKVDLIDTVFVN